jgi:hypothetical protein
MQIEIEILFCSFFIEFSYFYLGICLPILVELKLLSFLIFDSKFKL